MLSNFGVTHSLDLLQYPVFKIEIKTCFLDRTSPMAKQQLPKERIISKFKFSWHLNPPPPQTYAKKAHCKNTGVLQYVLETDGLVQVFDVNNPKKEKKIWDLGLTHLEFHGANSLKLEVGDLAKLKLHLVATLNVWQDRDMHFTRKKKKNYHTVITDHFGSGSSTQT
jgi:hypothetical protein